MNSISDNNFRFKRYHKVFGIFFFSFCIIFVAVLIYARVTTDDTSEIENIAKTVTPDSLKEVLITPSNPNSDINLTLDTIKINDYKTIDEITKAVNKIDKFGYSLKNLHYIWEADLILKLKSGRNIKFYIINTDKGIDLLFTNVMLDPQYLCNELKPIFERLANYK